MIRPAKLFFSVLFPIVLCGCNPVTTVVKLGMKAVGTVVADEETDKLGNKLIGHRAKAADEALGKPEDVWTEVYGQREWRVYRPKTDILDTRRTVVAVANGRIQSIQMIQRYGEETDLPLELIYFAKVKGKSPRQCESELKMGAPMLTVRSTKSQELLQIYDARLIKELPSPHDCFVRFDNSDRCTKLDLIEVEASTN